MSNQSTRTVLITGGSSGIGFEMAKQMIAEESTVIICGRSQEKLDDAKKKIPQLTAIQCDITNKESRREMYEKIFDQFNDLNMLINNAGFANRFSLTKVDDLETMITEEWQTNYLAPVMLAKELLPVLIQNKGTIVNITSGLAYVPLSIKSNYCATKAALHSMTQSMRVQLAKHDIKVVEIFFPAVDTPFQRGHSPEISIQADEAAAIALKGLNSGKEEIRVKKAALLYAISRLMPNKAVSIINKTVPDNVEDLV